MFRVIRTCRRALATAVALFVVMGCSSPSEQAASRAPSTEKTPVSGGESQSPIELAYEAALSAPDEDAFAAALARLKSTLPKVEGDFVTEGDLLRSDRQLEEDVRAARRDRFLLAQGQAPQVPIGPELVAAKKPNGSADYWGVGHRTLTYAIDRSSFKDPAHATLVETHIKQAVADWEAVCPVERCGLDFVFRDDPKPTHQNNTFIVKSVDAKGVFIAAAFFPSYASAKRVVSIDPSFFTTTYDKAGVLRHELGHIIGYRHEQARSIPGCKPEGSQWIPITPYDPHSVMHYMCGGGGTLSLQLSDTDKQGHVKAYGGQ